MESKLNHRATLFGGLVESTVIGLCVGYWMGQDASSSPILSAMVVAAGFVGVYVVWQRTRRVFWPQDFEKK